MMMDLDTVDITLDEHDGEYDPAYHATDMHAVSQPAYHVNHYAMSAAARKPEKAKWSQQEDSVLQQAVSMHDGKNWKSIASFLKGKTEVQCLHRWTKVLATAKTRFRSISLKKMFIISIRSIEQYDMKRLFLF